VVLCGRPTVAVRRPIIERLCDGCLPPFATSGCALLPRQADRDHGIALRCRPVNEMAYITPNSTPKYRHLSNRRTGSHGLRRPRWLQQARRHLNVGMGALEV